MDIPLKGMWEPKLDPPVRDGMKLDGGAVQPSIPALSKTASPFLT
jgi:hypothetical protein